MASTKRRLPRKTAHHPEFPRAIARFSALEGGQFGTVELVAITDATLELQLGADFVRFTQPQAREIRDAFDRFIALKRHPVARVVEEVVEEEVVEVETIAARRPSRAKRTRHASA